MRVRKHPAKTCGQFFRKNSLSKIKRNSSTSFCRSAGRTSSTILELRDLQFAVLCRQGLNSPRTAHVSERSTRKGSQHTKSIARRQKIVTYFAVALWLPSSTKTLHAFRKEPDTFKLLRHVMTAILFVRPKCSHRRVSLKESPLKPVQILKHAARRSTEQTSMRTKCISRFKLFRRTFYT